MTVASLYAEKPAAYFGNARRDIIALLPDRPQAILEVGCGTGGTAMAARAAGKVARYVGVELDPASAETARAHLDEVVNDNAESADLARFHDAFDVLIISEVLEHLVDPWSTLSRLVACLKPGGTLFASSPNVANLSTIRALIGGGFEYRESGVMDRSHLRWFTPATYRRMMEDAGIEVQSIGPVRPYGGKARVINALTRHRFAHLFQNQIMVRGRRVR